MSQHNGASQSPGRVVARSMADVAHDVVALAELQAQLAKAELTRWARSFIWPTVLLASALMVTLGCIPVLLLSLAYALIEWGGLSHSLSLLIAGAVGLALAGGIAAAGFYMFKKRPALLEDSKEEFSRNVSWIKQVLKQRSDSRGEQSLYPESSTPVI